jgi:hypothetical protein
MFTNLRWIGTGWTGAPSYTNFRARGDLTGAALDAFAASTRNVMFAMKAYAPPPAVWTPDPTVNKVDELTGVVRDVLTITTNPGPVTATGSGSYSNVVGACVVWRTGVTLNRRFSTGRTFFVPLAGNAFDATGRLAAGCATALVNAALAYVATPIVGANGHPVVWHKPHKGLSDGSIIDIKSVSVNSATAELKSRRG